jgi:hypothetical protein
MVEFTRPRDPSKPTLIHSIASRSEAVEDMVHTINKRRCRQINKKEVQTIFQCAMVIRKAIEQGKTWKFQGSLTVIYEGTPKELILLMTFGMSLHCYYNTRSKKLVDLVAHAGAGVSY